MKLKGVARIARLQECGRRIFGLNMLWIMFCLKEGSALLGTKRQQSRCVIPSNGSQYLQGCILPSESLIWEWWARRVKNAQAREASCKSVLFLINSPLSESQTFAENQEQEEFVLLPHEPTISLLC